MQQMDVNPPAAAAREPVSMVSACSMPGSRRCTCMSMKPGATIMPGGVEHLRVRRESRPAPHCRRCGRLRSARRPLASKPDAGSITRPFLMRSLGHRRSPVPAPPCARRCRFPPGSESPSAANRRPRDDSSRPAVDGPGMHHDHVRLGQRRDAPGAVRRTGNIRSAGNAASCCRSSCTRSIMMTSASRIASRISWVSVTPGRDALQVPAAAATPDRRARYPRRISTADARSSAPRGCARCRR